jgi:hypothetical protein
MKKTSLIHLSSWPDRIGTKLAYTEAGAANQSGCQLPVDKIITETTGVINAACTSIIIADH